VSAYENEIFADIGPDMFERKKLIKVFYYPSNFFRELSGPRKNFIFMRTPAARFLVTFCQDKK